MRNRFFCGIIFLFFCWIGVDLIASGTPQSETRLFRNEASTNEGYLMPEVKELISRWRSRQEGLRVSTLNRIRLL